MTQPPGVAPEFLSEISLVWTASRVQSKDVMEWIKALFVAKRSRWFNACRATRRDKSGQQCDERKRHRRRRQHQGIHTANVEQVILHQALNRGAERHPGRKGHHHS